LTKEHKIRFCVSVGHNCLAKMEDLSIEIVQKIVFEYGLDAKSVLCVALTSKNMYGKILGPLGRENWHDRDQMLALMGVAYCVDNMHWRAARIAIRRGIGSVEERIEFCNETSSLLRVASAHNEKKLVEMLLQFPHDQHEIEIAYNSACRRDAVEVVEFLLQGEYIHLSFHVDSILHGCIFTGSFDVLQFLCEQPEMDHYFPYRIFEAACRCGIWSTVEYFLVRFDLDLSRNRYSCVSAAIMSGNITTFLAVFNMPGIVVTVQHLIRAVSSEQLQMFDMLLEKIDLSEKTKKRLTETKAENLLTEVMLLSFFT